jgi:hypothetical protein
MLASISPQLRGFIFWLGLFVVGAGFGLLASQLGNINMSAVSKSETAEAGGLQGTFQNLGSSFGTALVGSIFMLTLTSGFISSVSSTSGLPQDVKNQVIAASDTGVSVISPSQGQQLIIDKGGSKSDAQKISSIYEDSQIQSLRNGLFLVVVMSTLSLLLSRNLPKQTKY